jgi:hypothetical protein
LVWNARKSEHGKFGYWQALIEHTAAALAVITGAGRFFGSPSWTQPWMLQFGGHPAGP